MPEGATAAAASAAMEGVDEVIDILIGTVLPIVLFLAGVFTYSWLGGASAVESLLNSTGLSSGISKHVAPLVPAAIAFSIGGGFWMSLGKHKNIIAHAIGRIVGSYFLGVGVGYVLNAAFGNITPGALDNMITSTGQAVRAK